MRFLFNAIKSTGGILSNNKVCTHVPDVSVKIFVSSVFLVLIVCMFCSEYLVECNICTCNRRLVLKVIEALACEQWNLGLSPE